MVSADNLNFDCLQLIFAYLQVNDLVSVSLVSRSFLAAAVPRLYRRLVFRLNQAKRYSSIISPFASVLAHPNLSLHVRSIDIRAVPIIRSSFHPVFMNDCSRTIFACPNLQSFTCTVPNALPSFLNALQNKKSLVHLRVNGSLTTDQVALLVQILGLQSLTLDAGTWNLVDAMPKWMKSLQTTLTSLTLYSLHDLNEDVLIMMLTQLPSLLGLHIVACSSKIDQAAILRIFEYTPRLEAFSFTAWESSRSPPPIISRLPNLKYLAIDTHTIPTVAPTNPSIWTQMLSLTRTWSSPLKSLVLKVPEKQLIDDAFVRALADAHGTTLRQLTMINCMLSPAGLKVLATQCHELERLGLCLPLKDICNFSDALSRADKLSSIADVGSLHPAHGPPRVSPTKMDVMTLLQHIPNLTEVASHGRVWTADKRSDWLEDGYSLKLRKVAGASTHWFMPPEGSISS